MDNGLVCRWMTGQAKISPKISAYYSKPYCTLPLKEIEDTNALLQLASAFYSKADTYRATVEKIIETVHSHTFAVELAAKLLENAFPYMDNYNYHKGMNGIIQELKGLLKTKSIGTNSDRALLLDFQATLETKPEKAIKLEKDALAQIENITADNARLVSNLHANLGGLYRINGHLKAFVKGVRGYFSYYLRRFSLCFCLNNAFQPVLRSQTATMVKKHFDFIICFALLNHKNSIRFVFLRMVIWGG